MVSVVVQLYSTPAVTPRFSLPLSPSQCLCLSAARPPLLAWRMAPEEVAAEVTMPTLEVEGPPALRRVGRLSRWALLVRSCSSPLPAALLIDLTY